MLKKGPAAYVCGAGVTHYDSPSKVARWKKAEQERAAGEAAAKVRAHDDYMEALRRFREMEALRQAAWRNVLPTQYQMGLQYGYDLATRDMDEALLDAMTSRDV